MAQNTNLNVTPYYDDFDKAKNFYRVLFRPGFPIQARELTQTQSILQNQIENVGSHLFKDGAMVIPGQIGYDLEVDAIMLQESFLGADVELYRTQLNNKIVTGISSTQNDSKVSLIGVKDKPGVAAAIFEPLYKNSITLLELFIKKA